MSSFFSPAFTLLNILDVLSIVGFSATHWRELGGRLKPNLDMDAIKANHNTVEECLEDVVEKWLRDGDDPSWETLAEAVTLCRKGGGKNVALKIKQEIGIREAFVLMWLLPIWLVLQHLYYIQLQDTQNKGVLKSQLSSLPQVRSLLLCSTTSRTSVTPSITDKPRTIICL